MPDDAATIDHIFPREMIRAMGSDAAFERWYVRNKAWACPKCNGLKGSLHPAQWLWALGAESRNLLKARLKELSQLSLEFARRPAAFGARLQAVGAPICYGEKTA